MGDRGPIGKRAAERLGHRAKGDKPQTAPAGGPTVVPQPAANPNWHPIALSWYKSLAHSGQSVFYEPSDWSTAIMIAEQMSRELEEKPIGLNKWGDVVYAKAPITGQSLAGILKGMTALLATEGDRRRAQLELSRRKEDDAEEAQIIRLVHSQAEEAFGA